MTGAAGSLARTAAALRRVPVWPAAIWLVLAASALIARPPLSAVELQPLSIAWWMWLDGAFLPSTVGGGEARPPLLFWLIHLGWTVFGVSEIWARLVVPLMTLGALLLIRPTARRIWPSRPDAAALAGVVLVGSGGFALFSSLVLADTAVILFLMLGLYGIAMAWRGRESGWLAFGVALGLGVLMNGPVILLHLLPLPLLAPLWMGAAQPVRWSGWYGGLVLGLLLGLAISLAWILPALSMGGPSQLATIFLDPIVPDLIDLRSWCWSLLAMPVILYPWLWWRTLWRAAKRQFRPGRDEGLRFCSIAAATSVIVAALTSGGHFQGLLPALPALALITARLLAAHGGKPKDFHAVIPGLLLLLVGLVLFLLNMVPVAHLDAVWREFIGTGGLPIWLGGISLVSGLILLGGGYLLAQMTPREMFSRTVQLALLPVLLVATLNLEFLFSLRRFFDLGPVASQIQTLQQEGIPVAVFGRYHGEFDFSGRLEEPLAVLKDPAAVLDWSRTNEAGVVVSYFKGSVLRLPGQPIMLGIVGNGWAALWSAATIRTTDGAVLQARF